MQDIIVIGVSHSGHHGHLKGESDEREAALGRDGSLLQGLADEELSRLVNCRRITLRATCLVLKEMTGTRLRISTR